MEPTSVWRIENIDDIWITQDVEGISLMLKNRDDLYKIMMTGDAIDNFNNTFVIAIKKDIEELKAKSKDISDDNASLLETNKKLKQELNNWQKEAADCLKLRDEAQKEAYKLKKENEKLKKELDLEKAANEAQREREKINLPETPFTDAMIVMDHGNLIKENEFLRLEVKRLRELKKFKKLQVEHEEKIVDNVNHPIHYTGKYECIDVMQDVFGDEATNDFCLCNAFKYIWRARKKNGLEDVKKAVWYLNKYIEEAEKDGEDEVTGT